MVLKTGLLDKRGWTGIALLAEEREEGGQLTGCRSSRSAGKGLLEVLKTSFFSFKAVSRRHEQFAHCFTALKVLVPLPLACIP